MIDNESSDFLPVTSGVPQGSILGPLQFLILINDMPNVISKETSLLLFAEDSRCFHLILGRDDGDKLQDDLNELFQWSSVLNGIKFRVYKFRAFFCAYEISRFF